MCCCDQHIRDCTKVQIDGICLHYLFKKFLEQPSIMHDLWGKHANCQKRMSVWPPVTFTLWKSLTWWQTLKLRIAAQSACLNLLIILDYFTDLPWFSSFCQAVSKGDHMEISSTSHGDVTCSLTNWWVFMASLLTHWKLCLLPKWPVIHLKNEKEVTDVPRDSV